ncbi:MAG: AAA family ATPase [Planctomycetaceae bacterium]
MPASEPSESGSSTETPRELATDEQQAVADLQAACTSMKSEIGRIIVGQDDVIDQLLIGLFCRAHCLLVGVPGLAKTLLCSTVASILQLDFRRIQFTPDLMPSDVTGTDVLQDDLETGRRTFQFVEGPLFTNVLLADEINRTPPKTQAALLEAMQERQVTVGARTWRLPDPFFTLATQNPIEQEGTYPLPEAQLDRFMFNIIVDYPDADEELEILRQTTGSREVQVQPVLTGEQICVLQQVVRRIPCGDHVLEYARDIVRTTRPQESTAVPFIRELVSWGAGPRAGQFLVLGARAHALLHGRGHVTTDDIRAVARPVLRHRIMTNFSAASQGISTDDLIAQLLEHVPVALHERARKNVLNQD